MRDKSGNVPGPTLAVFDLDNTLLSGDSEILWANFLMAQGVLGPKFAERNKTMARRYHAGEAAAGDFCTFFARMLAGKPPAQWQPLRSVFMRDVILPRLPPAAFALISQYRTRGDLLVLSTATSRFLVEETAQALGFEHLLATELAQDLEGRFTGNTQGVLNMREGKVTRLKSWLAERGWEAASTLAKASFHSDSINDLPLLLAVGLPVVVDPDAKLAAEASARGWPVLHLPRA